MRLNKTAIALTTAAALGVGVIPTAGAQETNAPKLDDGVQQATGSPNDADESIFGAGTGSGDGATQVTGNAPENPNDQLLPGAPEGSEPAESNSLGTNEQPAPEGSGAPESPTATETETATGTATATATATATNTATGTATPTTGPNTTAIVLGSLGALAGLGLIIAGVQYFVNKDGDLVKDPNRVDQPASPEEKAESDQVKKDHGDEIAKQVEANGGVPGAGNAGAGAAANGTGNATANGERGMNASTGVAELPAGLVALLILSIVGAAGYAFSRRETV